MARNVSQTALQAMLSQQTGEIFLTILKISHPDLEEPFRFVNDRVDLVRSDGTYKACAFEFVLPDETEDNIPSAEIAIDNIDRQIIEAVRPLKVAPEIEINIVLHSTPDVVELGPVEFKLKEFTYDKDVIRGRLGYEEDFLNQQFPKYRFNPRFAPGLF